jgi:hypothetical protein
LLLYAPIEFRFRKTFPSMFAVFRRSHTETNLYISIRCDAAMDRTTLQTGEVSRLLPRGLG